MFVCAIQTDSLIRDWYNRSQAMKNGKSEKTKQTNKRTKHTHSHKHASQVDICVLNSTIMRAVIRCDALKRVGNRFILSVWLFRHKHFSCIFVVVVVLSHKHSHATQSRTLYNAMRFTALKNSDWVEHKRIWFFCLYTFSFLKVYTFSWTFS